MFKKINQKITMLVLLVLAASVLLGVPVSAIEWNGNAGGGSGGHSTSDSNGGYELGWTTDYAVGYRFTWVDYYGTNKRDPIDVLATSASSIPTTNGTSNGFNRAQSAEWMSVKMSKIEIMNQMYSGSFSTTSFSNSPAIADTDVFGDSSMPANPQEIERFIRNDNYLNALCRNCFGLSSHADLGNGEKVLVEPLFYAKLNNVYYVMTISEIGAWGGYNFGWDQPTTTSGNPGSYGNVAYYLNKYWASLLYSDDGQYWNPAYDASAIKGVYNNNNSQVVSFRHLVDAGFGVGFAYTNSSVPTTEVDLYSWGVEWYSDAEHINKVAESSINGQSGDLVEGNTYYPVFWYGNNSNVAVNAYASAWSYNRCSGGCFEWPSPDKTINGNCYWKISVPALGYTSWNGEGMYISNGTVYGTDSGQPYGTYDYSGMFSTISKLNFWLDIKCVPEETGFSDTNSSNDALVTTSLFAPIQPSITQVVKDEEFPLSKMIQNAVNVNRVIYSGQRIRPYGTFTNLSSFKLNIWNVFKPVMEDKFSISRDATHKLYDVGESLTWLESVFRPYNPSNENKIMYMNAVAGELSFATAKGVSFKDEALRYPQVNERNVAFTKNVEPYTLVPTDLEASELYFVDTKTGERIDTQTKLQDGQEVRAQGVFVNNTSTAVAVMLRAGVSTSGATEWTVEGPCECTTYVPDKIFPTYITCNTIVEAGGKLVYTSNKFNVSMAQADTVTLKSLIRIQGLENTSYETDGTNNAKEVTYGFKYPFEAKVVEANSSYRRDTDVITSFKVRNNNSYRGYGTATDIMNNGELLACLKVWDNPSRSGEPFAEVYCEYAIPSTTSGQEPETLIWFQWNVPVNAPDRVYAELVLDAGDGYTSKDFINKGTNSKNSLYEFEIVQPVVTNTPDTTFAHWAPYWFLDGAKAMKTPSVKLGLAELYDDRTAKGSMDIVYWKYYKAVGDTFNLVEEHATFRGSSITLIPDGARSAHIGYDFRWKSRSGYGFRIETEFMPNVPNSTRVQTGYALYPEFLYKIDTNIGRYLNSDTTKTGFDYVIGKHPISGGVYATYSSLSKGGDNTFDIPMSDSTKTYTHYVPIWYPSTVYRITCYVADFWTPGGMLSAKINSSEIDIEGNMYDDFVISRR